MISWYEQSCMARIVFSKELYQWNASFDRFRGISVHRSPVQADSASWVVGYFRFHCLH